MSQAVLCPVCNGNGKYSDPWDTVGTTERTCHGCGGMGWVEVSDSYCNYSYPSVLYPNPYDYPDTPSEYP